MTRAITVKVATTKVIKALENALDKLNKDYASQEANEAKYQKAYKAWQKEIGKWAITNFSKAENLRTNYRSWNKTLNVDFDIITDCLLYTSPSPRDRTRSRMPSSA